MTNQESYESALAKVNNGMNHFGDFEKFVYSEAKAIKIALEKQMPKKVIKVKPYGSKCSVCDCYFDSRAWKSAYCGNCGQKLDWSE